LDGDEIADRCFHNYRKELVAAYEKELDAKRTK